MTTATTELGRSAGGAETKRAEERKQSWAKLAMLGRWLGGMLIIALVAILGADALAPDWRPYFAAMGISLIVLLCASVTGAAVGFIFALPKAVPLELGLKVEAKADAAKTASTSSSQGDQGRRRRYLESNGSLERISDWLATMIVGIGLTQLYNINSALAGFRDFIEQYARIFPVRGGFSAGILPVIEPLFLIFGVILGFLFMYIYTRLCLSPLFNETEELLDRGEPRLDMATSTQVAAAAIPAEQRSAFVERQAAAGSGKDLSLEDAIGRMLAALYKSPPDGFNEVLAISAALSVTGATKRADYWFYLAAAFGQQHKFIRRRNNIKDVAQIAEASEDVKNQLMSARNSALDAANQAVQIDPAYKARIRLLLSRDTNDDDLSDFADDEAFKQLVR